MGPPNTLLTLGDEDAYCAGNCAEPLSFWTQVPSRDLRFIQIPTHQFNFCCLFSILLGKPEQGSPSRTPNSLLPLLWSHHPSDFIGEDWPFWQKHLLAVRRAIICCANDLVTVNLVVKGTIARTVTAWPQGPQSSLHPISHLSASVWWCCTKSWGGQSKRIM